MKNEKNKFNSISSEELKEEYNKVRKRSAKCKKKKKSKRESYKYICKRITDYYLSQNDIKSKTTFFKTLLLESQDYIVNEHKEVINNFNHLVGYKFEVFFMIKFLPQQILHLHHSNILNQPIY